MEDSLDSFAVDSDSVPYAGMPDDSAPKREALEEPNSPFEWDHPSLSPMSESEMPVEDTKKEHEVQHGTLGYCGNKELTSNRIDLELQDISEEENNAVDDCDLKKVNENGKNVCEDGHDPDDLEEVCAEENEEKNEDEEVEENHLEEQEEELEGDETEVQEDAEKEGGTEDTEEMDEQGDAEEVGEQEFMEEVGEEGIVEEVCEEEIVEDVGEEEIIEEGGEEEIIEEGREQNDAEDVGEHADTGDVGKEEIVKGMGEQDVVEEVVDGDNAEEVGEQDDANELGRQSDEEEVLGKDNEEETGKKENVEEAAEKTNNVKQVTGKYNNVEKVTERDNVEKEAEKDIQNKADKQTVVNEKIPVVKQMNPAGNSDITKQTNSIQEPDAKIGERTVTSESDGKDSTDDITEVINKEMDVVINSMEEKEQISFPENDQKIIQSLVDTIKSTVESEESLKENSKATLNFDWFKDELKEVSVKKLKIDYELKVFNDLSKITYEILEKEKQHKLQTVTNTKSINYTIKSKRVRTPKKVFEEEYKPSNNYRPKQSSKKRRRLFQENSKSVDTQHSSTRKKQKRHFSVEKQQHCGFGNKSSRSTEKETEEPKLINGGKVKNITCPKRKSTLSPEGTRDRAGRSSVRKRVKWSDKTNDSDPLLDKADNKKTTLKLNLNKKKTPKDDVSLAEEILQCSVKLKPLSFSSTVGKELMRCSVDLQQLPEHLVPVNGRVLKLTATLIREFCRPSRKLKLGKTKLKHEASVIINVNPLKKSARQSIGKTEKKTELIYQKNKAKSDVNTVLLMSKRKTTSYKRSNR